MKLVNTLKLFLLTAVTIASSPLVMSQDSEDEGSGIEEVIVTVERREMNLQDFGGTAISISAEELDMGGIINIADLAESVPGLDIGQSGNNLEVWVRGIGSSNNTELGDPAAAFHFNGVYIPRPSGIGSAFLILHVLRSMLVHRVLFVAEMLWPVQSTPLLGTHG